MWVESNYFVRLLRFFRMHGYAAPLAAEYEAFRDMFTLEEIGALLWISEMQSVIDCLTESTRDGIGGPELEPIGTKTRSAVSVSV